jgi:TonB family protein
LEPKFHAVLITRAQFQVPNRRGGERGYLIHLTNPGSGAEALGRATALNRPLNELTFTPVGDDADKFDRWRAVELVINGQELFVRVDGAETLRANGLENFAGVVGFQTRRGGVQLRNVVFDSAPAVPAVVAQLRPEGSDVAISVLGPQVLQEVRPEYPPEAGKRKAQGEVSLEVVVQADGTVGEVRVVKPLDRDLDRSAVAAARKWKFTPAQLRDGTPVAVWVTINMAFRPF